MVPKAVALSYLSVGAFKVVGSDVTATVNCNGTLEANAKQDISFSCPLKISKSYVKIGDYVKKGERLFDIDKSDTLQALLNSGADTQTATQSNSDFSNQISTSNEEAAAALQQALSSE